MSRIIAGTYGGRRLRMPPGEATRPTTDRVREALFSAVIAWAGRAAEPPAHALAGLAFLDLYAGSGAVGLEAASRGAGPVLLVEGNRRTALTTARNVATVGSGVELRTVRVEPLLAGPVPRTFDVVFADPPYELADDQVAEVVAAVVNGGWLAGDGLAVVERSVRSGDVAWPQGWQGWQRRYGETVLHFASR